MKTDGGLSWRGLTVADRELWIEIYSDPDTMRHIADPLTREAAARSFDVALAAFAHGAGVHRVLVEPAGVAIGLGLLAPAVSAGGKAEVEIGIVLRGAQRGRGLGRCGLALLVSEADARFGAVTISVQYRTANRAAARMVASLGFVEIRGSAPDEWVRARLGRKPPTAGFAVDQQGTAT